MRFKCNDCGLEFKQKEVDDIPVYADEDGEIYCLSCPNCGKFDTEML